MSSEPEVIIEQQGVAGVITLNRPQALNALTHGMLRDIQAALTRWESDSAVGCVIMKAAGGRAFCAGGDIRAIHDLGKAGQKVEALSLFHDEYRLNRHIKRYKKPYVSLIDGIVMGGGVGVSLHGSHVIAGDRYSFAMPEVGIGFFPDVGGTFALPRLPFHAGHYLALTGQRIGRADAVALGLVTHAAASADLGAIEAGLVAGEPVDALLARFAVVAADAPLVAHRALIDRCFAQSSVIDILAALDAESLRSGFAKTTAAVMRTKSPTSMAISLEQMRRGATLSFEEAMVLEMRIVTRVIDGPDFYEGVRAVILDKDQKPQWSPPTMAEVTAASLARYFAPLANDLTF